MRRGNVLSNVTRNSNCTSMIDLISAQHVGLVVYFAQTLLGIVRAASRDILSSQINQIVNFH